MTDDRNKASDFCLLPCVLHKRLRQLGRASSYKCSVEDSLVSVEFSPQTLSREAGFGLIAGFPFGFAVGAIFRVEIAGFLFLPTSGAVPWLLAVLGGLVMSAFTAWLAFLPYFLAKRAGPYLTIDLRREILACRQYGWTVALAEIERLVCANGEIKNIQTGDGDRRLTICVTQVFVECGNGDRLMLVAINGTEADVSHIVSPVLGATGVEIAYIGDAPGSTVLSKALGWLGKSNRRIEDGELAREIGELRLRVLDQSGDQSGADG